jgi:hypothetical protein
MNELGPRFGPACRSPGRPDPRGASPNCGFLALAGPTGNFVSASGWRATWAKRCSTAARMASGLSVTVRSSRFPSRFTDCSGYCSCFRGDGGAVTPIRTATDAGVRLQGPAAYNDRGPRRASCPSGRLQLHAPESDCTRLMGCEPRLDAAGRLAGAETSRTRACESAAPCPFSPLPMKKTCPTGR